MAQVRETRIDLLRGGRGGLLPLLFLAITFGFLLLWLEERGTPLRLQQRRLEVHPVVQLHQGIVFVPLSPHFELGRFLILGVGGLCGLDLRDLLPGIHSVELGLLGPIFILLLLLRCLRQGEDEPGGHNCGVHDPRDLGPEVVLLHPGEGGVCRDRGLQISSEELVDLARCQHPRWLEVGQLRPLSEVITGGHEVHELVCPTPLGLWFDHRWGLDLVGVELVVDSGGLGAALLLLLGSFAFVSSLWHSFRINFSLTNIVILLETEDLPPESDTSKRLAIEQTLQSHHDSKGFCLRQTNTTPSECLLLLQDVR
mmetsp:Transcript_110742/g.191973  ORF Transcript_110742/g.191973 Transcript_110742/m.191973 type:complete len:312 (+) Transcript_110742:1131-2066(+)